MSDTDSAPAASRKPGGRPFVTPFILGLATFFFVNGLTLLFWDDRSPALTVSLIAGFTVYFIVSFRRRGKSGDDT